MNGDGADGNGDGIIDSDDYLVWKSAYGAMAPGAGQLADFATSRSVVPEVARSSDSTLNESATIFNAFQVNPGLYRQTDAVPLAMLYQDDAVRAEQIKDLAILSIYRTLKQGESGTSSNCIASEDYSDETISSSHEDGITALSIGRSDNWILDRAFETQSL